MYNRIAKLCEEKNITITRLATDLGIARSIFTELKMGRTKKLSSDKAAKVADYFGVSTDYILGKSEVKEESAEETPAVGVVVSRNGLRTSVELKPEDAQMIEELIKKIHASYGEE